MDVTKVPLNQFAAALPLATRAAGVYTMQVQFSAPALLSTVFFRSGTGSVLTKWYIVTTGAAGDERFDIGAHPTLSGPPLHDRLTLLQMTGTAYLEVTVAGGSAEFGVMVQGVPDFPIAFDTSMPIAVIPFQGVADTLSFSGETTPDVMQTVISEMVPNGKRYDLYTARVVCRFPARFVVKIDGALIGSGATGPGESSDEHLWRPLYSVASGATIDLELTQSSGPAVDAEAYLQFTAVSI